MVRVWNPYVKKKPVMTMQGHNSPVIEIRVNERLEQVISISELKEIRIYDLNTQACVQVSTAFLLPTSNHLKQKVLDYLNMHVKSNTI